MGEIKRLVEFENMIFGDSPSFSKLENIEEGFLIKTLTKAPSIRPFLIDEIVSLCKEYCESQSFKYELISHCSKKMPTIVYRLFRLGVYSVSDIQNEMHRNNSFSFCSFFRDHVDNVVSIIRESCFPREMSSSEFSQIPANELESMIKYGFLENTIGYSLKYDDVDKLLQILDCQSPNQVDDIKWPHFEWALKPNSLNLLAIAGFFSSIKCFKHLLIKGFSISEKVLQCVVFGGSLSIFHLCHEYWNVFTEANCFAAEYCRTNLLEYFFQNGFSLNVQNCYIISHSIV